jgi:hypothetical protein
VKTLAFFLVLVLQAPQVGPLVGLPATLRQLRDQLDQHRATFGATPELTAAKRQLRGWVESRLADLKEDVDTRAFGETLHAGLAGAGLLCNDLIGECDWNFLGYVDDVRVSRADEFLVVVTAVGIWCGFDESAYVYAWEGEGRQWRRVWEHEQDTYTQRDYLPQTIHDVQISSRDAGGGRLLLTLGSQTICGGAFKDLYARAWRMDADYRSARVLDWTAHANDAYPRGRVLPDDVLFQIDRGTAIQVDPIASLPRDFVVEWLSAPWEESRARSESPSLEPQHAELHRKDGVGDFPAQTVRCSAGSDLWQVGTHLYEGPKRYYRVRWRNPYRFTLVAISETPFPDCTLADRRGEMYPNLLDADLN